MTSMYSLIDSLKSLMVALSIVSKRFKWATKKHASHKSFTIRWENWRGKDKLEKVVEAIAEEADKRYINVVHELKAMKTDGGQIN